MRTHEEIVRYFDAKIIGSYMFVEENLLSETDVNDVDLLVTSLDNIRKFLEDSGYSETKPPHHHRGYEQFEGSLIFTKENKLPIHLCKVSKDNTKPYSIEELVKQKLKRGKLNDLIQIKKIINNKIEYLENNNDSSMLK